MYYVVSGTFIVVIGGEDKYPSSVEVVHIDDNNNKNNNGHSCVSSIPSFPFSSSYLSSVFFNNTIISCGGFSKWRCFQLDSPSSEWNEIQTDLGSRPGSTSTVIGNHILYSGGYSSYVYSNTPYSTVWFNGTQWFRGPQMPSEKYFGHCMIKLNETHVFFTSGPNDRTFIMDIPGQRFVRMPSIPDDDFNTPCGLLYKYVCSTNIVLIYVSSQLNVRKNTFEG
jgi:hypothetical protein